MSTRNRPAENPDRARFEYRVWGNHRKARRLLRELASEETSERVDDCYLLIDDPMWNAKLRGRKLKIKQLVAERKGFERWVASKHRSAETAPSPFDELFDGVDLDKLLNGGIRALTKLLDRLDPDLGVRAVFVTKHRQRFRIGDLKAEVTDIEIVESGEVLRTLAIEGDDLDELVALRRQLGLRKQPNTPVHQAIDTELDGIALQLRDSLLERGDRPGESLVELHRNFECLGQFQQWLFPV